MMASSVAASRKWNNDVFISFKEEDTGSNFISHLCEALRSENIKVLIDDHERGEEISASRWRKIEESMICLIVFSENYASSPRYLDELVKILECKKTYGQTVLPVFFRVDPSDVENQSGCFADALLQLQKNYNDQLEKLPRWRADLKNAASLAGWDSRTIRCEGKLVKDIAEQLRSPFNGSHTFNGLQSG